jgi:hypothetical protein
MVNVELVELWLSIDEIVDACRRLDRHVIRISRLHRPIVSLRQPRQANLNDMAWHDREADVAQFAGRRLAAALILLL